MERKYSTQMEAARMGIVTPELEAVAKKENRSVEDFYRHYTEILDEEFSRTADEIGDGSDKEELMQLALQMAVSSYAQMLSCKKILEFTASEEKREE